MGVTTARVALTVAGLFCAAAAYAQSSVGNYGTADDVAYGAKVWPILEAERLVGDRRISARTTKGDQPHGTVQQIMAATIEVDGREVRAVVKANHRGEGVDLTKAYEDPREFLTGYAVMIKREAGYDPAHADWFWVVYNPDGSLRQFENKAVAGRVDTGSDNGCIGCHRKYGGKDFEMLTSQ